MILCGLLTLIVSYYSFFSAGWGKVLIGTSVGWFLGSKYHCRKLKRKLDAKHKEEQKALYQQYYNDVYTLQSQNAELAQALEQYGARGRT